MKPPRIFKVIDRHGGFTYENEMPESMQKRKIRQMDIRARRACYPGERLWVGKTDWKPAIGMFRVVKGSPKSVEFGRLLDYDEHVASPEFAERDENYSTTVAFYRVTGFKHPVLVWFDEVTKKRIE